MWRAQKPLERKIRLQIIGQKILAHLSPEAEDLRVHWLATTRSLVTGPKNDGHERRSTVAITYRASGNGALKASTLPYLYGIPETN